MSEVTTPNKFATRDTGATASKDYWVANSADVINPITSVIGIGPGNLERYKKKYPSVYEAYISAQEIARVKLEKLIGDIAQACYEKGWDSACKAIGELATNDSSEGIE